MFNMNLLNRLSLIAFISLITNPMSVELGSNATNKEIDCSTSHKMWKITLEDFEAYCLPTFCYCLSKSKKMVKLCPPEWSKDLFDAFAMMWYLQNKDMAIDHNCKFKDYYDETNLRIQTTVEKQNLFVVATGFPKMVSRPLSWITNSKGDQHREGWVNIRPVNDIIKPRLNTKGLWDIKMNVRNSEILSGNDIPNYYPSSYRMRSSLNKRDLLTEELIYGPFGGKDIPENAIYFHYIRYSDQRKQETFDLDTQPILLQDNFEIKSNRWIQRVLFRLEYWICLGRKINPLTNRTHWTGEGCRPKVLYKRLPPGTNWGFNDDYEVICECEFVSLGFNAPDDPPDLELVAGFNTFSNNSNSNETTTTTEAPKPIDNILIKEPSITTIFTVWFTVLLMVVCMLLILITISSVVYYKLLAKK